MPGSTISRVPDELSNAGRNVNSGRSVHRVNGKLDKGGKSKGTRKEAGNEHKRTRGTAVSIDEEKTRVSGMNSCQRRCQMFQRNARFEEEEHPLSVRPPHCIVHSFLSSAECCELIEFRRTNEPSRIAFAFPSIGNFSVHSSGSRQDRLGGCRPGVERSARFQCPVNMGQPVRITSSGNGLI